MKIKEVTRTYTIEFNEEELEFIIEVLRSSNNTSAENLARALKEHLAGRS